MTQLKPLNVRFAEAKMKRFKIFIDFEGDAFEDEIEAETLEEATEIAREIATERLEYGAEEIPDDEQPQDDGAAA